MRTTVTTAAAVPGPPPRRKSLPPTGDSTQHPPDPESRLDPKGAARDWPTTACFRFDAPKRCQSERANVGR